MRRESGYETLYRSLLNPLELYQSEPVHTAPVGSARGNVRILAGQTEVYLGLLHNNPAYISPSAAYELNSIIRRIRAMVTSPTAPTLAEQRKFLPLVMCVGLRIGPREEYLRRSRILYAMFMAGMVGSLVSFLEEEVNRSRRDLLSPLHPENVTSQHKFPVEMLRNKYKLLMKLLQNPERVERLTNQLEPVDQQRFFRAHEVLSAEKMLLDSVLEMEYVGDFPRFR